MIVALFHTSLLGTDGVYFLHTSAKHKKKGRTWWTQKCARVCLLCVSSLHNEIFCRFGLDSRVMNDVMRVMCVWCVCCLTSNGWWCDVSSEQRKNYTKTSINGLTETSCYHVEVRQAASQIDMCLRRSCNPHPSLIQHLTTFVMDRKEAMLTIEDGIRKLRLLDAKGKVWTQDMILQVDDKSVSLIDSDTKVKQNQIEHTLWCHVISSVWMCAGSNCGFVFCLRTSWRTFLSVLFNTVRPSQTLVTMTPSWHWCVKNPVRANRTCTSSSVMTSRCFRRLTKQHLLSSHH